MPEITVNVVLSLLRHTIVGISECSFKKKMCGSCFFDLSYFLMVLQDVMIADCGVIKE